MQQELDADNSGLISLCELDAQALQDLELFQSEVERAYPADDSASVKHGRAAMWVHLSGTDCSLNGVGFGSCALARFEEVCVEKGIVGVAPEKVFGWFVGVEGAKGITEPEFMALDVGKLRVKGQSAQLPGAGRTTTYVEQQSKGGGESDTTSTDLSKVGAGAVAESSSSSASATEAEGAVVSSEPQRLSSDDDQELPPDLRRSRDEEDRTVDAVAGPSSEQEQAPLSSEREREPLSSPELADAFAPTSDIPSFWTGFRAFFPTADEAWIGLFGSAAADSSDAADSSGAETVDFFQFCAKMRELQFLGNLKALWRGLVGEGEELTPDLLEERVYGA